MIVEKNKKLNISFPTGALDNLEQGLLEYDAVLFENLLKDKTTKKNIKWGTDDYKKYGPRYNADKEIKPDLVTGLKAYLIQPRASKPIEEQIRRTRQKAEVFTPSWVCNKQNNLVDEVWFSKANVFNKETSKGWIPTKEKISFPNTKGKTWQDYVEDTRLEITCGEAPYLVNRYDTVSGKIMPVAERIGLLDRKLRIVNENTKKEEEWFMWAEIAFQHIYGFDYQGDNILIARENLLYTFVDYYVEKYKKNPEKNQLRRIAHIISWNIWQMDGLTMTCPFTHTDEPEPEQLSFSMFIDMGPTEIVPEIKNKPKKGIPCRIMDWKAKKSIEFKSLIKEKN